jgi:uncharacterized protein DUF2752
MSTGSETAPVRATDWKKILFFSSLAMCALGVVAYFVFDPTKVSIFPPCMFHQVTGLDCPGCGAQRALHQLLHGNIVAALQLNAMFVLSLPIVVLYGPRFISRAYKGEPTGLSTRWLWFYLVAWLVFGILRNLPVPALAWFAA